MTNATFRLRCNKQMVCLCAGHCLGATRSRSIYLRGFITDHHQHLHRCRRRPHLSGQIVGRAPDSCSKGREFESRQERREIFFFFSLLFGVRSNSVLPQWHVKDPSHSANSAGGMLHLGTYTPLTQQSRSGLTMPLSGHRVGTYHEMSSHATCQGTLGHGRLNSLSHCGLILA